MVKMVDNLSPWGYTYVYKIIKDDCLGSFQNMNLKILSKLNTGFVRKNT